ncbi:hypothetical protein BDP81DRAFT_418216, partial [Colletotrichum phormii]
MQRMFFGWTPLHYGARRDIVGAFPWRGGADINARDLVEWTPLHYACKSEKIMD